MIVFNLKCSDCSIEFEGWFDNSSEFAKQKKKKFLTCPSCNGYSVDKFLMAPNLNSKSNSKSNLKNKNYNKKTVINKINKYKKLIEKNFDYVGDNFSEEAKKMKYGETSERPIYGEANLDQTKELIDENIEIVPLPWTSSKKSN